MDQNSAPGCQLVYLLNSALGEASTLCKLLEESNNERRGLKAKVDNLNQKNQDLQDRVRELERQVGHLHEKNYHLKKRLAVVDPLFQPWTMPCDVLRHIIVVALPPSYILDSSLASGPNSAWCQALSMKRCLVEVSRTWRAAAVEFLYKEVSLRRIGQVSAFLRTLESPGNEYGHFVRKIEVSCFVPRGYDSVYKTDLERIFALCPNVARISFTSPYLISGPGILPFPVVPMALTHLDFSLSVNFSSVLSTLRLVSCSLKSLTVCVFPEAEGLGSALTLPNLESLCVTTPLRVPPSAVKVLAHSWSLPCLKRLTFVSQSITSVFEEFCQVHGKQLTLLHIRPYQADYHVTPDAPFAQACMAACPVLQRIIILNLYNIQLSHPTVQWIDVWVDYCSPDDQLVVFRDSSFPSLRGIRWLGSTLMSLPDIPELCSPDTVGSDADRFELVFPGIRVRHDYGHLWRVSIGQPFELSRPMVDQGNGDGGLDDGLGNSGDSKSDSSYVDSGSDSESDSDADPSQEELDEALLELTTEHYAEEDWEADHEETLAVYSDMLQVDSL